MCWVILLMLLSGGCAQYISPPAQLQHPVRIYVTDYGRHSSVVLPDPAGGYSEFAYGDYDFFAAGHNQVWRGPQALLASRLATLGMRKLPEMSNAVDALRTTGASTVIAFDVDAAHSEGLRQTLEARYWAAGLSPLYNPDSKMDFMPDTERYHLFNTCNHLTRRWLEDLGCRVEGNAWSSNFILRRR